MFNKFKLNDFPEAFTTPFLTDKVKRIVDFTTMEKQDTLVDLNDNQRKSFIEIAAWIKENL